MIESVEVFGIRGIAQQKVVFGPHTLIIGPNGSGKTGITVGLHYLVFGHVAGHKSTDMWANASDLTQIRARAVINGRTIERRLTKGATMSESIVIDGVPQKISKGSASAIMLAAFGREPLIVDIPEIQRATSTERRRLILGMVCDLDTLEKATEAEKTAREAKNGATSYRQQQEQALNTITEQMSSMERPAGSVPVLKTEAQGIEEDLKAARQRVADGEANDRARQGLKASQEAIPGFKERVAGMEKALAASRGDLEATKARQQALQKPERPAGRSKALDQDVADVLTDCTRDLTTFVEDSAAPETDRDVVESVRDRLVKLLPNKKAQAKYDKELFAYNAAAATMGEEIKKLESDIEEERISLDGAATALAGHEQVVKTAMEVGPGPNDQDRAHIAGLESRQEVVKAKLEALGKVGVMEAAIERSKIAAEKAAEAEEAAKQKLAAAQMAMADLIGKAAESIAAKSREVLPDGCISMTDDGKDLDIYWNRDWDMVIPWVTLSGGEKAVFDCALGHVLAPKAMIIIEGAEVDDYNLGRLVGKLNGSPLQIVVLTCHEPDDVEKILALTDWKLVRTEARKA